MTEQTRQELDEMSLSMLQRLNRVCNEFESACQSGQLPEIDDYLTQVDAANRATLLRQLIPLHIDARQKRGESPVVENYASKYPQIDRDWLKQVLAGELDRTDGGEFSLSAPAAERIPPGTVVENYEIVSHIGAGGMADVYRARHTRLRRDVAVKHLKDLGGNAHQHLQRFEKEMILVAGFSHPNLVTAYDAGEFSQRPFLVTEFIDGTDLAARVRKQGTLPVAMAVDCILQAARGLAYVHQRGVVHRDVKPSNLLLDADGCVKVSDLGLARFTQHAPELDDMPAGDETSTEVVMGTVDYMAPEQGRSATFADEQSDIYSLGCTLFFLLTGRPVFPGGSVIDRLHAHRFTDPPNLAELRSDVPAAVNAVFQKMLAKEPGQRYAGMSDVVEAFESLRGLEPADGGDDSFHFGSIPPDTDGGVDSEALRTMQIPEESPAASRRSRKIQNRNRNWILIAAGLFAVIALVIAVIFAFSGPDNDDSNDPTSNTPVAVVPFDNPKEHQQAWANSLDTPVELNEQGIDFVLIPKGRFRPGSTARQLRDLLGAGFRDEFDFGPETQQPEVTLPAFYFGVCEITHAQFKRFVDATNYRTDAQRNGNGFGLVNGRWRRGAYHWRNMGEQPITDNHPAGNISWNDAVAYCKWLTQQSDGNAVYRLPTEHEWEFAARAGTTSVWFFGDDYNQLQLYAWHGQNTRGRMHPVRQLRPNGFGLFDIYGNESEWCADRFLLTDNDELIRLKPTDPGTNRNLRSPQRGGNFQSNPTEARSAVRRLAEPTTSARGAFRIVREIQKSP